MAAAAAAGTPNSIEVQIDNFLEQFKRSASKAMDGDWSSSSAVTTPQSACSSGSKLKNFFADQLTHEENSNFANNGSTSSNASSYHSAHQNHQQNHQHQYNSYQNTFQHQSSVTSNTSVQTVLNQSLQNSANVNKLIENVCQNGNHFNLNTFGSCSSLITTNGHASSSGSIMRDNMNSAVSVSSAEEPLSVGDVADLLHPQYAIITGGRSKDGCPLITFPDYNNFQNLTDLEYQKLMLYLTSVPSLSEADLGFNLIVDRRKDRWAAVKAILLKISIYFPAMVHIVYVIRPAGFLQKAISEVSNKFFKDEFRFRVIVCGTLDELYEYVCRGQLTAELGGELPYSHHEWIQQRISLEKFSGLTNIISGNLDAFMKSINDMEFPNSVEATEQLINDQGEQYEKLKEDILSAGQHGEVLLEEMKSKKEYDRDTVERFGNISSIERLLVQLEETERQFEDFWTMHLSRLKKCLELRRFEQDFRELQNNFDRHLKTVSDMTEIGETVTRMDQLLNETKEFQLICGLDVERAQHVISTGQRLIGTKGCISSCPKEVVQPKCDELSRVCALIHDRISKRIDTLAKARELMERVEKANKWCTRGIELLATQRIEKCSVSAEIAEQSLQEIQDYLASAAEFKLYSPKEIKNEIQENTTLETKALVSQVLQRIDDVQLMCDKRMITLKKLTLKPPRPVQTVTPEPAVPLQPPGGAPHPIFRQRRSYSKIENFSPRPRSIEGPLDSGISISSDTAITSSDSDLNLQSQTDSDERKLKRGHVLAELLETERIYVAEMGSILKGYKDEMLSEEMSSLVPPGLQGKSDILFGNLHELYTFHNDIFLKDLENCISTTELVALCFVQRRDTFFRLYSYYCQNIPRSERLRETLVDTHLFLQECQKKLGHKLPLAAYLLKPVQRITKYQLLLKDLLKFSDTGTCSRELQKALDCMLVVLKCVNDSMHQIAITGFPADLSQQGELLMQDSFQVWTESKKDLRLRLKTQNRHIFLYQKAMLFCKQGSKTGHNKSTYQFKHWLQMSQIGLTESVRGDSRRFEVWLQGRQEVHTIQATTIEIKNKWVAEIKRVLLNQLEELKGEKIKQYGLNHKPLRHMTSWDVPQAAVHGTPNRTVSCDQQAQHQPTSNGLAGVGGMIGLAQDVVTRISNINDDSLLNATGISSSSSEHDNQESNAWSSDYSNSEDEFTTVEDSVVPGHKFVSLADYCAMGNSEVSMKEAEVVELLKVGCAGWWFVKVVATGLEGWAPAAYLEAVSRKNSRLRSARSQDRLNEH
ncbi:guanine nucleotide exchange factor DBS-like isoform X2 [Anopheles stephensi]|uniref:guanine nucleotide exchange factor DBS-like isoform X2 n=1 Tax=Anopheles stephensi TaxID=30069 RepID=UPI001658B0CD|nr:guanine nucleotide exchange factor DBS-like isoform X2 [Anopheles stephensi]XP_035911797.1 guanine nucleotide exchange factor DBS-like isoform X2 [Anopheles stephensi]